MNQLLLEFKVKQLEYSFTPSLPQIIVILIRGSISFHLTDKRNLAKATSSFHQQVSLFLNTTWVLIARTSVDDSKKRTSRPLNTVNTCLRKSVECHSRRVDTKVQAFLSCKTRILPMFFRELHLHNRRVPRVAKALDHLPNGIVLLTQRASQSRTEECSTLASALQNLPIASCFRKTNKIVSNSNEY